MIVEVNESGDILIPAELVQSAPHVRLQAERKGDLLVLRPVDLGPSPSSEGLAHDLPVISGRLFDDNFTFRREDLYADPTQGSAVFIDTNVLIYAAFPETAFHTIARTTTFGGAANGGVLYKVAKSGRRLAV